jgi:serine/threonine protein phosphatase PrpC
MVTYLMPYKVLASGLSDVGLVRQNNEDVWCQLPEENFFVLADGMGGHQAGEVASKETIENLCALFKARFYNSDKTLNTTAEIIERTIRDVNELIFQMSTLSHELRGMGTTLCCALIHPDGLIYAHVGDSRIYRLRQGVLTQLTKDHSLRREMMDAGKLNADQVVSFAYKNIITRAIGTEAYVNPSIEIDSIIPGDLLLLCSDGLTDMVDDEAIEHLMQADSIQSIAKLLIKEAKKNGGNDNITVVVVKIQ